MPSAKAKRQLKSLSVEVERLRRLTVPTTLDPDEEAERRQRQERKAFLYEAALRRLDGKVVQVPQELSEEVDAIVARLAPYRNAIKQVFRDSIKQALNSPNQDNNAPKGCEHLFNDDPEHVLSVVQVLSDIGTLPKSTATVTPAPAAAKPAARPTARSTPSTPAASVPAQVPAAPPVVQPAPAAASGVPQTPGRLIPSLWP